jgi:hypothetical protein
MRLPKEVRPFQTKTTIQTFEDFKALGKDSTL